MDCLGPECAAMLIDWLKSRASGDASVVAAALESRQGLLWKTAPYQEEAPAIACARELGGAIEHLEYAVFRRYNNVLTRAERTRLENTIDNALFKIDRFLVTCPAQEAGPFEDDSARAAADDSRREGRDRETDPAGTACRSQATAARVAFRRVVRGVRRRAIRDARFRGRASGRLGRPGGRPAIEAARRAARGRSVQVSQAGSGRLARTPEVSGHDSPHAKRRRASS